MGGLILASGDRLFQQIKHHEDGQGDDAGQEQGSEDHHGTQGEGSRQSAPQRRADVAVVRCWLRHREIPGRREFHLILSMSPLLVDQRSCRNVARFLGPFGLPL